ncbi:MAG TPA: substrate-binding domain-containing protein [Thermoclostridium sp.]|nr:substrate-binding domain-containing protein [Thermoclostridium sp.]
MKKRISRKVLLVTGLFIAFSLCSCTNPVEDKNINIEDKIVLGLVIDGLVIERWQKDRDIFVSKAKELGAEVIVRNANEDTTRQIEQIYAIVEEGIDCLVIIPYDKDGLSQCIKAAKKKGIPVLSYDRLIKNSDVDAYISFDGVQVGKLMAGALYEKVPEGNYIVINGSQKDNNSYLFNTGFKEALKVGLDNKKIHILDEVWSEDWREEEAYNTVSEAITKEMRIDAVIGGNDRLAEGAIKALSENRLLSDVYVVGHDAELSACQRIVEGTQLATVYKPIKVLAEGAAQLAVDIAKGKEIEYTHTIHDGKNNVPFIQYKPILVTKKNMVETVIKDGFHTMEEVYRNVPEEQWPN